MIPTNITLHCTTSLTVLIRKWREWLTAPSLAYYYDPWLFYYDAIHSHAVCFVDSLCNARRLSSGDVTSVLIGRIDERGLRIVNSHRPFIAAIHKISTLYLSL